MSRVVVTLLSPFNDLEVDFFVRSQSKLRAMGHELVFLTGLKIPKLLESSIRIVGDYKSWEQVYRVPASQYQEGIENIDVPLWHRRVKHSSGCLDGSGNHEETLSILAGVSKAMLEALEPGLVVGWSPIIPSTGVLCAVASQMGIPVSAMERGMFPETLNFDEKIRGIRNSMVENSSEEVIQALDDVSYIQYGQSFLKSTYEEAEFTRWKKLENAGVPPALVDCKGPRVLVLGAHDIACGFSPHDPERLALLPGFESGFELAKQVSRSHQGITVFKPHPVKMWNRKDAFDSSGEDRLYVVGEGAAKDLIRWADVVVCYGTSLEYAALALDRPLVLSGKSALYGKGIAYEALYSEELPSAIDAAINRNDFENRKRRLEGFCGYLMQEYLLPLKDEDLREAAATRWCQQLADRVADRKPTREFSQVRSEFVDQRRLFWIELTNSIYQWLGRHPVLLESVRSANGVFSRVAKIAARPFTRAGVAQNPQQA
ncbi:hypothetical protein M4951_14395 [Blastopirellula sp. J2-11]|uniref:hypothetical protein n=1 Tax=Blastopirellula sp. J2-11 TaxID=2943192 RepID=UPI0021CA3A5D|nr:hypothetical protein [Blastopirellula sp. J2-11]UUO04580.1 hypothetical protein M4951_14395 [Blastopirellula sp. J2-11]